MNVSVKILAIALMFWGVPLVLFSQSSSILTARQFFSRLSERYDQAEDFFARVTVSTGNSRNAGTLLYKNPGSFYLNFEDGRFFVSDSSKLMAYAPNLNTTFTQTLDKPQRAASAGLFSILKQEYSVAYLNSPAAEPLFEGSKEMVIKLLFTRTVYQGATIKSIELSVNPSTNDIRQVLALTNRGKMLTVDFNDIRLNQGIKDHQFSIQLPPTSIESGNFLYTPDR